MKPLICYGALLILLSCDLHSGDSSKMVMGAPKAIVTTSQNYDTAIKGPLAYAPKIPLLESNDTVEVKMDVRHKLYHISKDIAFAAWLYGDSLPGPVLRIKVGQTVKFSMTDRSNDSLHFDMQMQPMPHSIDFHSAMVNPEDKYRSINPGETISFTW